LCTYLYAWPFFFPLPGQPMSVWSRILYISDFNLLHIAYEK